VKNDTCWLPETTGSGFKKFQVLGTSEVLDTIRKEAAKATVNCEKEIVFSPVAELPASVKASFATELGEEAYVIKDVENTLYVVGGSEAGTLYGYFHLLRLVQMETALDGIEILEAPKNPIRMINHWDNMDEADFMGSVERGYAGNSIFFENKEIVKDKSRIEAYAKLIASVGINAVSINNVNVHKLESQLITERFLPEVAEIAAIFRKYAVKFFLSVNFASTMDIGGLNTADPLDEKVGNWWKEKIAEVYRYIPDFGGVVVKADSEGRPGPFTYGRTHADGANMLAEALKPFGGIVFWRCFVYNCTQDWRDRSIDRARAAYDHFMPIDGQFMDNVILQVKNGPMDFQVREGISPLLGGMTDTNQVMELQITQEYTGHSKDVCFLVPQWKEILAFDTFAKGEGSTIAKVADGSLYNRPFGGIVAVGNIGNDANWTGHKLAQANLYGYGRLIWNPELSSEEIASEWIKLTFGVKDKVVDAIKRILLDSWSVYEKYTAPLGVGFMVEPHLHYGPNIDGYEYSRWGTYHFADRNGIGVDRTAQSGTGYTRQYFDENFSKFEDLSTCPDELLLFFHHVPYTHKLQTGKTVIQHIYDTHFEGVEDVKNFIDLWQQLQGDIDKESFENVANRLKQQLNNATLWRDQVNTYFYRKSGIADEAGRTIY